MEYWENRLKVYGKIFSLEFNQPASFRACLFAHSLDNGRRKGRSMLAFNSPFNGMDLVGTRDVCVYMGVRVSMS